ncbi:hypothetical protein RI844_08215 [Thalassotalea fonticola]|uniref:Uncharacterized protein n=1 Tax=Thalassotalea fonticola TaxID=3065649 RepID=A0ABZ0GTB7_9GAMM|nr:hypothetical protein RI844_08215 [Colwelliaceae bacterium S1-1]
MMKTFQLIPLITIAMLVGCTSTNEYPISGAYAKINEQQILDPMAPENNAGIVNDLDGNYGKKVINSYQTGNYESKEGRTSATAQKALNSGG